VPGRSEWKCRCHGSPSCCARYGAGR
jgi:hypothetical protein